MKGEKNMAILDKAAALGESRRKVSEVNIEEVFQRDVVAKLEPLVDVAPGWLKEIKQYAPVALATIDKVLKTPYAKDKSVGPRCDELQGYLGNIHTIQVGRDRYSQLSSRNLLNSKGELDINAAANLVDEVAGYLKVGRGCRTAMEDLVAKIEARIKELMDREAYNRSLMPQDLPPQGGPGGVSIVPPEKPTKPVGIVVKTEMNARVRE